MLPLALVFLAAQSAFAAPSVAVNLYENSIYPSVPDNGRLVSSYITNGPFEFVDGGDVPLYAHMIIQTINDLANSGDASSQATAVLQTIVSVGQLASGIPGDACAAAALNNAYASGNSKAIRTALEGYVQRVASYIDIIVQLIVNPKSVRYSSGPTGNCVGGGRSYSFEESWDLILAKANVFQIGLLNEEYCASKRLYNAFSTRSNNLAADITAVAGKETKKVAQLAIKSLARFLRVVTQGGNPSAAGADAKTALYDALKKV